MRTNKCICLLACLTFSSFSNAVSEKKWITLGASASHHYQLENAVKGRSYTQTSNNHQEADILLMHEEEHENLSHFMHEQYHRCGGFVAHDSEAEAKAYLSTLEYAHKHQPELTYSIDNPETVQALMGNVSTTGLVNTVSNMTGFYNRYYTQQSGVDASNWVKNHWQSLASSRSDIAVEHYTHTWAQSSVIVTVPGSEMADEIVIIGGHLDSINGSNPSSGRAPGADDNASGIAVLSEVLKAIVDTNYKPKRTVKIMGFAAEEVGLRGSKAIAQDYKASGKNVVGMAQFDMSGHKGGQHDIVFITDYTNSAQNNFMSQLLDKYLPNVSYGFDRCGYGCSDHASWYQQSFPASFPFESRMRESNRLIHTANDTEYDAEHSIHFAKLASAYIAELAKTAGSVTPPPIEPTPIDKTYTDLNVSSGQWWRTSLPLGSGYQELVVNISGGTGDADLYVNFGTQSSTSQFQCRPYQYGNEEVCTISFPKSGNWYFDLRGYTQASGVTLTIKAR
ncbi:M20/M25/M40 family metallo-hydrolase [Pseudoalteromonas luteoviolacea]|uniref:Aminopeptidase n=1 Tax=Pseudoalteromonas luteoviolacea S4054 TaxID=1129367 RepID=A0A0F6A5G5_9GAMM|nr:M20/M25/M40 family metallo-hydrolase [Pseudoalteromonas luteoviolacea]AOT10494.1 hypothetical protein S4054249_21750 [Pseudoalteromonas luteoviolacea]AOT15437.1 hypothetical protein S40542_21845 [Pseudoalteromonas luteoviolacea]AOT20313.1 hypothetical protein S4054_21665 [Pseudoalteromonas luteoviolacea]KKE81442.1 hypothetical protein N479_02880 [Pseudoalteromonas luteoviolacea S4054]